MSDTSNAVMQVSTATPPCEEMDYREVRLRANQPLPEYFSTTINVVEEARKATFRRINRMLRGEIHV